MLIVFDREVVFVVEFEGVDTSVGSFVVVFEGNYDDYVFLWIGEIPSMCSPRIAEPSSTPQDFPKMYKACGPKLYAIAENDFQQLIQDNGFIISVNLKEKATTPEKEMFLY